MKKLLNYQQVRAQSNAVFNQFGESVWKPNAKFNAGLKRKDTSDLKNVGIGRVLVLAAMGESAEEALPTLKKYRDKCHIVVNDKSFGYFVDHGVIPDYVMLCDANIKFSWIEKHIQHTESVKLICTPYANTEWTRAWRGDRYFYVAEDAIGTEEIFLDIFGPSVRVIPAASNVSNAMLVFFLGSSNMANINWSGYDRYLLVGYDYSWRPSAGENGLKTGKYYAFEDPRPKRFYMNHRTVLDINRDWVHTSESLLFSVRWMTTYLQTFRPPVVNCSGRGMLEIAQLDTLENQLRSIDASKKTVGLIQSQFKTLALANKLLEESKANFEQAREAIYAG